MTSLADAEAYSVDICGLCRLVRLVLGVCDHGWRHSVQRHTEQCEPLVYSPIRYTGLRWLFEFLVESDHLSEHHTHLTLCFYRIRKDVSGTHIGMLPPLILITPPPRRFLSGVTLTCGTKHRNPLVYPRR